MQKFRKSEAIATRFLSFYIDENNIGVKGIKMFQINELKNLEHLSMSTSFYS